MPLSRWGIVSPEGCELGLHRREDFCRTTVPTEKQLADRQHAQDRMDDRRTVGYLLYNI